MSHSKALIGAVLLLVVTCGVIAAIFIALDVDNPALMIPSFVIAALSCAHFYREATKGGRRRST